MKLTIFTIFLLYSIVSAEESTCPLVGISYDTSTSNRIAIFSGIDDWRLCGTICKGMITPEDCKFWTFYDDATENCHLFNSDEYIHTYDEATSGDDTCF